MNSDRKHILVFVPSIEEAIQFAQEYPNSAAIYSGMHDSERERVISEFRKGNIRVIFNVRVLSTGFDYTKIDCIILGISTASIALYYQILGRGTRIDDEKEPLKSSSNIGKPLETMTFGVHKGLKFKDIPKEYREWMLKSFDWHAANMNLKQAIEGSL